MDLASGAAVLYKKASHGTIKGTGGLHLTGLTPPRAVRWQALDTQRLPTRLRRRGWHCPGPPAGDDVSVAHRVVTDREFEHAEEHHPATPGVAPVEAEDELVQVAEEMRFIDRPLVGAKQPTRGQRGDAVYGGQPLAQVLSASPSGELTTRFMSIADFSSPW